MVTVPMCKPCLTFILACWALLMAAPATADSPDFPAPPRAQVSWVSSNMVYNGRVMQVRTFNSRLPAERVLQYYRNLWQHGTEDRPGFMESDAMQPWRIISRIDKDYMMTVQVMSKGNDSTGYLSASPLDDVFQETPELGGGFPMMQGSTVVNDIHTPDMGRKGRTLFITNEFSVNGNANYYRDHYDLRGWRVDMDKASSPGLQHVLAFSKGREKVNIVISRNQDRSFVVANSVE